MAHIQAARSSEPIPLPRERPAGKTAKPERAAQPKMGPQQSTASRSGPLSLGPDMESATSSSASLASQNPASARSAPRTTLPFATAATTATSPLDLSAVKQALDLVRKNRQDEATATANSLTDPLARKLVEWVVLRSEDGSSDFSRYSAFINANPSWPSIPLLRRRAEAALWQDHTDPQTVIAFFASDPPRSAKGDFARGLACRCVLFRSRGRGPRDVWQSDYAGRRCGAHGCPPLCRG